MEFYEKKGRRMKQLLNRRVEKIDGIWTVMNSEMQDLRKKNCTLLCISEIQFNRGIPDRVLSLSYMTHGT